MPTDPRVICQRRGRFPSLFGAGRGDLRARWDARARQDALFWSCVRERYLGSRDVESCLVEGGVEALELLAPALELLRFDPRGQRLLDLGAGFGRMFRGYAALGFAPITGADASLEMARRGVRWQSVPGSRFVVIDGHGLGAFRDGSFDFCISRGVLAFQPSQRSVLRLVSEVHRVLAPGGAFLLHLGGQVPTWPVRLRRLFGARRRGRMGASLLALAPDVVLARLREFGSTDLALLPDPRRPRDQRRRDERYYVAGRKGAAASRSSVIR